MIQLPFDLEQVVYSITPETAWRVCPDCDGTGSVGGVKCPGCLGYGMGFDEGWRTVQRLPTGRWLLHSGPVLEYNVTSDGIVVTHDVPGLRVVTRPLSDVFGSRGEAEAAIADRSDASEQDGQ